MALLGTRTTALIASALATVFQPTVREQINRSAVALNILPYEEGDGQNLQWDAVFGDVVAGSNTINDGADVSTYNNDDVQAAVLQWGTYNESFAVTGKAMAAAKAAKSPSDLVNLFGFDMRRAINRLAKAINKDIYTGGGGTNQIAGLGVAIANSGTYAGISRATYTQWKSTVLANGAVNRNLSFSLMRDALTSIYNDSGEVPDVILCPPALHDSYGALFGTQRRYLDEVRVGGRLIRLDGGYKALEFDGIPILKDVDAPANKMRFLNTQYIRMRQLGDGAMPGNRAPGTVQLSGTAEAQGLSGTSRLYCRINPLAVTGDAFKVQLILYPQLQVEKPNAMGSLDDVQ